jgi:RND family efflux transporter MFP subunit
MRITNVKQLLIHFNNIFMKSLLFFSFAVIVLQACSSKASEKQPVPKTESIAVKLIPVQSTSGSARVEASGVLSTESEARLSFKIGGIVESVNVDEGQRVRKGQLLATLKSAEISAQVQQVKLAVDKAQRDFTRAQNLYNDSVATLEQVQNARTALELANQNLRQVSFNQAYSRIYAPSDGFVSAKIVNAGELVNPGDAVLMVNALSASSKWVLKASVSDKDWDLINNRSKAIVRFDAYPGKEFPASVSKKSLSASASGGAIAVELEIEFGNIQPAAGIFGNATIHGDKTSKQFSIPYEALLEANGKGGFIFVTNDKKTVKRIPVTIGTITQDGVQITSGLEGYEYVVTAGSPYLNEQSQITVRQ